MDSHMFPFFRGVAKAKLKFTGIAIYKTSMAAGKKWTCKYGLAIRLKI